MKTSAFSSQWSVVGGAQPSGEQRTTNNGQRTCRLAFTLVELLVVIGTISALAALLLPTLSHAKASARRIECISLQKSWVVGFHEYADDNDGLLPREGYHTNGLVFWNNWAQVQNAQSRDVWYNAVAPYLSIRPASSYALPASRLAFYERNSFFHCPRAPFPEETQSVMYQTAIFSMAMNSQIVLRYASEGPVLKMDRILRPSETVLLLDNLLEQEKPVVEQQDTDNLGQPAAYATRFAGRRHGRSGILAFVDGHAEALAGEKVVATTGPNIGGAILPAVDIFWEAE